MFPSASNPILSGTSDRAFYLGNGFNMDHPLLPLEVTSIRHSPVSLTPNTRARLLIRGLQQRQESVLPLKILSLLVSSSIRLGIGAAPNLPPQIHSVITALQSLHSPEFRCYAIRKLSVKGTRLLRSEPSWTVFEILSEHKLSATSNPPLGLSPELLYRGYLKTVQICREHPDAGAWSEICETPLSEEERLGQGVPRILVKISLANSVTTHALKFSIPFASLLECPRGDPLSPLTSRLFPLLRDIHFASVSELAKLV